MNKTKIEEMQTIQELIHKYMYKPPNKRLYMYIWCRDTVNPATKYGNLKNKSLSDDTNIHYSNDKADGAW